MRQKLVSEDSTTSLTERQSEEMTDTSDRQAAKEEKVESSKWKPAIEKKSSDASKVSSSNDKDNEVLFLIILVIFL